MFRSVNHSPVFPRSFGPSSQAWVAFGRAREAYARACSVSDSEKGDDLPSLLYNWGVGLYAMAQTCKNVGTKGALLEEAVQRLRVSGECRSDEGRGMRVGSVGVMKSD